MIDISEFIDDWSTSYFRDLDLEPWQITKHAVDIIRDVIQTYTSDYAISGDVAVHPSAIVEQGAIVKGPTVIGPNSFVSSSALLRGGVFIGQNCIVGPCCELKTTFLFHEAKVAHLSFVGDSIIGSQTNIEAGAVVTNYRNEMEDKRIRFSYLGKVIDTGVDKFGALIGDRVRIGANAVVAPGAIVEPDYRLPRLGLLDQHPDPLR